MLASVRELGVALAAVPGRGRAGAETPVGVGGAELPLRVAVLADIHGNLSALDAVLNDIDAAGVDAILLNGDIATGPLPAETLEGWPRYAKRRSGCVATPIGSWSPRTTSHRIIPDWPNSSKRTF